jgi:hypothetical protein
MMRHSRVTGRTGAPLHRQISVWCSVVRLATVTDSCSRDTKPSTSTSVPMVMSFFRPKPLLADFSWGEVVWGVRRRRGYGPMDDPRAHAGRTQHAFLASDEAKALCGYRSQRRFSRRLAVPLAAATGYNPFCRRCLSAIPDSEVARETIADVAEPNPVVRIDIHQWPVPEVASGAIFLPGPAPTRAGAMPTSSSRRRNHRRRRKQGTHLPKAA